MRSGHSKHYGDAKTYFGYEEGVFESDPKDTSRLHFPGVHPDAAQWLVDNRDIFGLAVDTPSIDYGQSKNFETHQIVGAANVWGLENLANAEQLPEKGYVLYNMVHKLKEGSGGPSMVYALPAEKARGLREN